MNIIRFIALLMSGVGISFLSFADDHDELQMQEQVEQLDQALYSPFIERYILDELLKQRVELGKLRADMIEQITDREIKAVDSAVNYATNTMTYFFYLITGVSSVLVLVGWTSLREIKNKVHQVADQEISELVKVYEDRLHSIEKQLNQKTKHIEQNREEIELTQEVQSLWLRAGQEPNTLTKIAIYDQILKLKPDDPEACTYKADAVLELGEPQWALNLCQQALEADSSNSFAWFQLACANSILGHFDEAIKNLEKALQQNENYKEDIFKDAALKQLRQSDLFKEFSQQRFGEKVT